MTKDERFRRAEEEYLRLKSEVEAGRTTLESLESALQDSMIEHEGRWWMLGTNSGAWYVHDGSAWTPATPPQGPEPTAASGVPGAVGPTRTGGPTTSGGAAAATVTGVHPAAARARGGAAMSSEAAAAPATPARLRLATGTPAAIVLRRLCAASLALGGLAVLTKLLAVASGSWGLFRLGDVATIGAALLFGLAAVPLYRAIPLGIFLIAFGVVALLGLGTINEGYPPPLPGAEQLFYLWPAGIVLVAGIAGLLGSAGGYAISRASKRGGQPAT